MNGSIGCGLFTSLVRIGRVVAEWFFLVPLLGAFNLEAVSEERRVCSGSQPRHALIR